MTDKEELEAFQQWQWLEWKLRIEPRRKAKKNEPKASRTSISQKKLDMLNAI